MENLGVCYGGGKLSIHSLIYKMMRVIESKLKDDGGIDMRDSASAMVAGLSKAKVGSRRS